MKKLFTRLSLFLTGACLGLTLFSGCASPYTLDDLSAEKIAEIKAVYVKETKAAYPSAQYSAKLVTITAYYGTYDGNIVFAKHDGNFDYGEALVEIKIDGVYICTNSNGEQNPLVYLSSATETDHVRIVTLEKAYESGNVTKGDLKEIAARAK
ncbi:MAG: hypothetical protein J6Z36_03575 [Clostridia bacterium]|nr:hypothetical protein [Clostridia bacterium]